MQTHMIKSQILLTLKRKVSEIKNEATSTVYQFKNKTDKYLGVEVKVIHLVNSCNLFDFIKVG